MSGREQELKRTANDACKRRCSSALLQRRGRDRSSGFVGSFVFTHCVCLSPEPLVTRRVAAASLSFWRPSSPRFLPLSLSLSRSFCSLLTLMRCCCYWCWVRVPIPIRCAHCFASPSPSPLATHWRLDRENAVRLTALSLSPCAPRYLSSTTKRDTE